MLTGPARHARKPEMNQKLSAAIGLAVAAILMSAASAGAVDGTIEINQAKVTANGGTFPYKISTSGSYRLTGNLTVPSGDDGIDVNVANVTVDLNGFSITGVSGSGGSGVGYSSSEQDDVTVENGTITGFGTGVYVGKFAIVKNVHADKNAVGISADVYSVIEGCTANNSTFPLGGLGISCSGSCRISGNTANGNPAYGIYCGGNACVISGNTADANPGTGIDCNGSGCLILNNTIYNNGTGITASDGTTGYGRNVLKNTTEHSGGTSIGDNLCNGFVC